MLLDCRIWSRKLPQWQNRRNRWNTRKCRQSTVCLMQLTEQMCLPSSKLKFLGFTKLSARLYCFSRLHLYSPLDKHRFCPWPSRKRSCNKRQNCSRLFLAFTMFLWNQLAISIQLCWWSLWFQWFHFQCYPIALV